MAVMSLKTAWGLVLLCSKAATITGLPLVIHSRDADADMAAILTEETERGKFPFLLHCFSSGARLADVLGVDMAAAVADKLDKNARKYPEPQS